MSNMAQQRNLDDPETIIEFAGIVKNQKNLDALMLLTLADGQGTSAEGWSDWKESLVWQLHYATAQYLTDQTAFNEQMKIERETLSAKVRRNYRQISPRRLKRILISCRTIISALHGGTNCFAPAFVPRFFCETYSRRMVRRSRPE